MKNNPAHYILISCAVFARECYYCAAGSGNIIDIKIVEQGLHDVGEAKMSSALQSQIDKVDTGDYDAVLLAYGLCSNGIKGLRSRLPIVVPRAHDCITLLMGSKSGYLNHFNENPGTFYHSPGWLERAKHNLSNPGSTTRQMGMGTYEDYVKQYGEENAAYLMETLGDHLKNYTGLTYIDTQVPGTSHLKSEAADIAREQGLAYSEYTGNTRLLADLMSGQWDKKDFLVITPGKTIAPSYDEGIIKVE